MPASQVAQAIFLLSRAASSGAGARGPGIALSAYSVPSRIVDWKSVVSAGIAAMFGEADAELTDQ
jgi:hypothetical protein